MSGTGCAAAHEALLAGIRVAPAPSPDVTLIEHYARDHGAFHNQRKNWHHIMHHRYRRAGLHTWQFPTQKRRSPLGRSLITSCDNYSCSTWPHPSPLPQLRSDARSLGEAVEIHLPSQRLYLKHSGICADHGLSSPAVMKASGMWDRLSTTAGALRNQVGRLAEEAPGQRRGVLTAGTY